MTPLETIKDALIELGVSSPNYDVQGEEFAYAFRTLKRIIDMYGIQNLINGALHRIDLDTGSSQDPQNPTRPEYWKSCMRLDEWKDEVTFKPLYSPASINDMFLRHYNVDYPLKLISSNQYADIAYKNVQGIPHRVYLQPIDGTFSMCFDLVPQTGMSLHLLVRDKIADIETLNPSDDIQWEQGGEKMAMLRLAVELSSSYGIAPPNTLIERMAEAENIVKANNASYHFMTLKSDVGLRNARKTLRYNPARY